MSRFEIDLYRVRKELFSRQDILLLHMLTLFDCYLTYIASSIYENNCLSCDLEYKYGRLLIFPLKVKYTLLLL